MEKKSQNKTRKNIILNGWFSLSSRRSVRAIVREIQNEIVVEIKKLKLFEKIP